MISETTSAATIIKQLNLEPLPLEGGSFNETYRSASITENEPSRCSGTCIYYLLETGKLSDWHRVSSDEIWLYHGGNSAVQVLLFPDGSWEERCLGTDIAKGQRPQSIIPAGTWQATVPMSDIPDCNWSLFSAVVVPGFEFEDYVHGDRTELMAQWPQAEKRCQELGLAATLST